MIALLLLYWIGKYYYLLAERHNKNKWVYSILGIVTYYTGIIISGIILMAIIEISSPGYMEEINDYLFSLIALPFGILSTYILYKIIESTWKKNTSSKDALIDQIHLEEDTKAIP